MRMSYVAWRRSPLHHLTLCVIKVWTAIAKVHHPPAYALILHSEFVTISLQIWHSPDLYKACLVLLPPASLLSIRICLSTVIPRRTQGVSDAFFPTVRHFFWLHEMTCTSLILHWSRRNERPSFT